MIRLLPVLLLVPVDAPPDEDLRARYDALAYELHLTVDPAERELSGSATLSARVVADALDVLHLDLVAAMVVERVETAGRELAFEHEEDALLVRMDRTLEHGELFDVTVHYSGHPEAEDSFSGFHWAQTEDGRPWINTSCQGPGAHSWWPCKSSFFHPEDKPERIAMNVTVPAGLYAVSNGRLLAIEDTREGWKTYRWRHDYPLETYSVTLNAAPYVVKSSELELPGIERPVPYSYYVLPENAEKAEVQFAQVPRMLEIYSEAFGPFPFPESKFGLVETNFWGMEHSTAIAYGSSYPAWCEANGVEDRYARRNRYFDYILIHEVAHEWWGNAVSATSWGHFWIHEGFGTYAEGVYVEKMDGRERADEFFRGQAQRMGDTSRLYRGDNVDSGQAYAGVVYSKGACVLNTLRHYLDDDEAWWSSLRAFNERFRYGNAGSDDFRDVLEAETGRDWDRFFEEWVYGEGYPKLTGTVRVEGNSIVATIENRGSGATSFEVPLDLAWEEEGEPRDQRLMLQPGAHQHEIHLTCEPTGLRVVHLDRVLGRHDVTVE